MKDIKVLGPGCKRCQTTQDMVEAAAKDLGLDVTVNGGVKVGHWAAQNQAS